MQASKEAVDDVLAVLGTDPKKVSPASLHLFREFLLAARRRLPSDAAIAKDRKRARAKSRKPGNVA